MKALNQLNNPEKGKLLHQLFPNEMPELIDFVQGMCETVKENEELNRSKWNNGLFTFDFWLALAGEVDQKIDKYGAKLHKSSNLFADQLFDGYLASFTIHCIVTYTAVRQHENGKFVKAVDLFFYP
ncbi:hypothetical protein [Dyadobacter frigoris]|uniref:Uncharacterized protein n=1 Tax=Dyadobacter frigoris TaxID=2576211 RepID=A0A4U6CPE0_9BACT|nr:hypothetical protein [Dyadobacter frigoris]TKT85485.1 hypothetical protein FDK13_33760 [Dyadobacter frigoris]